jgi:hypothetical protein
MTAAVADGSDRADWLTRREPHPDAPGLGGLVPDPDEFVARALFRRAVWTPGRDAGQFATTAGLWSDALARGVRTPSFRLVRDGATLPPATYCRSAGVGHRTIADVIQPNRVLELHDDGATVVLQGLQLTDPRLARASNNVALALDHPVQVNAYLSPRAARGLELHFDYHDVFVLQLGGRKRWRVWEPLARTLRPLRSVPPIAKPTFGELGEPALDLTLEAGDCLYLPRGFPHAAETVESASEHLTIGVVAITWQRAVRHALDLVSSEDESLAASIDPLDVRHDPAALERLAAHLAPPAVRQWMAEEVWRRQPATRLRPLAAPEVDLDTALRFTPGPLLWLAADAARGCVHVGLGDRELQVPIEAHGLLAALFETAGPFRLGDVDDELDDESRLAVGRRLAIEGVVAPA